MKAVLLTKTTREIVTRPIPVPEADEVLIKVAVAASNPADWRLPQMVEVGEVGGCDAAGTVEAVGPGVTGFGQGDRVAAFTKILGGDRAGTYAEYTVARANTTFKLGHDTSFEAAAGVPAAFFTAARGIYQHIGLDFPFDQLDTFKVPVAGIKPPALLVLGGSSTVGQFATQLAKRVGFFVVATAGASAEQARAQGADVVLSYKSPSFQQDLADAVRKHNTHRVFDAVGPTGPRQQAAEALAALGGDNFLASVHPAGDADPIPAEVKFAFIGVGGFHNPDKPDVQALGTELSKLVGGWLASGELKPQKFTVVPGGLAGVAEGLKKYEEGRVSGEKLLYRVSETPGLA